jgi:hypothetical protein
VKPTEYPEEDARTVPFTPAPAEDEDRETLAEKPRYLDLPVSPEEARGQRNLAWGVVCLLLAAIGVWLGFKFDRTAALQCMASGLGAFGLMWLFHNAHVLRQRHGFFLALATVALLGAALPFLSAGLRKLDTIADERLGNEPSDRIIHTTPPPVPTAANAPIAPVAPELPSDDTEEPGPGTSSKLTPARRASNGASKVAKGSEKVLPPEDDGIVRDLVAPLPDLKSGKIIEILQDCKVPIDGRTWRLKAGQKFKFKNLEDGIVTFVANGQDVSIDIEFVRLTGESKETWREIFELAKTEAATRYPGLQEPGSREHRSFQNTWDQMRGAPDGEAFLKDPRWPVILADQLAAAEGWARAEAPDETTPPDGAAPAPSEGSKPASPEGVKPASPEGVKPPASEGTKPPASEKPTSDKPTPTPTPEKQTSSAPKPEDATPPAEKPAAASAPAPEPVKPAAPAPAPQSNIAPNAVPPPPGSARVSAPPTPPTAPAELPPLPDTPPPAASAPAPLPVAGPGPAPAGSDWKRVPGKAAAGERNKPATTAIEPPPVPKVVKPAR